MLVKVKEVESLGLIEFLEQKITVLCINYTYTGILKGVNDTCILLEEPSIVYETGPFDTKEWKDAQRLPNKIYIQISAIESFGIMK